MDIVIELKKDWWANFNHDLYNNYLKAKLSKL